MIAKNLIITFLGFLVALTAYFNVQSGIKEPFLGLSGITAYAQPQRTRRNRSGQEVPVRHPYPMSNNTHTVRGIGPAPTHKRAVENFRTRNNRQHHPTSFVVPGTYQSNVSPRFQPEPYSASINYNSPAQKHLGVPVNPLGYASEVGRHNVRENYHANNELTASVKLDRSAPALPTQTMDQGGQSNNSITMDRFMTATNKSRAYAGNDYIRGSLAVVPQAPPCKSQAWGITAAAYQPASSLTKGVLSVLGGENEQSTALNNFLQTVSGGTVTTAGGVANSVQQNTAVGRAMGVQTQMHATAMGPQNTISATQF